MSGSVNPPVRNTFAAGQLATASDFKKRLLGIAPGALYSGSTGKLDQILRRGMARIKTVETVAFQGYSREHKAWIFQDRAIAGGRLYDRNAEDYFEIGAGEGRVSVKSRNSSLGLYPGRQPAGQLHRVRPRGAGPGARPRRPVRLGRAEDRL